MTFRSMLVLVSIMLVLAGIATICLQFRLLKKVTAKESLAQNNVFVKEKAETERRDTVSVGLAICGSKPLRLAEAVNSIKSLIICSKHVTLDLRIFRDEAVKTAGLDSKVVELSSLAGRRWNQTVTFRIYDSWFPDGNGSTSWRNMYEPCSTQRLFLPSLLPDVDAILYMDVDTILLSDIREVWKHFRSMNSSQYAAMGSEDELPGDGWYNLHAKIPYYGPRGLNAGVLLLNLTRVRQSGFEEDIFKIHEKFKKKMWLADQDMLNIHFHFHPDRLYLLPCEFNYRVRQHCQCNHKAAGGSKENDERNCRCLGAEKGGMVLLHGNSGTFHDPNFFSSRVYKAVDSFNMSKSEPEELLLAVKDIITKLKDHEPCHFLTTNFTDRFQEYVEGLKNIKFTLV